MIGRTLPEPRFRLLDGGLALVDADLADLAAIQGGAIRAYVE